MCTAAAVLTACPGGLVAAGEGEGEGESEAVDRGPTSIPLDGDPNGLTLRDDGTLLIADDNNNRVLAYVDGEGTSVFADLPTAAANGPGLGAVAVLDDGRLVLPRFGFGSAGDVVVVEPDGTSRVVPNLDATRRRIGAVQGPDGTVYIAGFVVVGDGRKLGTVWRLDLDTGAEVSVLDGFAKPVGLLVVGDTLFISDQERREIATARFPDLDDVSTFASGLPSADLLSAGPDGALFTGSKDGDVLRIDSAGAFTIVASDFQEVRGTAYDAVNRRLFVADHDGDEGDGFTHALKIVPVGE
ncbi:MAG TPA: hypothetical protein VGF99_03550 [Myxococcota bacterium]